MRVAPELRPAAPLVLRENVFGRQYIARIQCAIHDSMSNARGKLFVETSRRELCIGHVIRKKEIVESVYMMIWSSYYSTILTRACSQYKKLPGRGKSRYCQSIAGQKWWRHVQFHCPLQQRIKQGSPALSSGGSVGRQHRAGSMIAPSAPGADSPMSRVSAAMMSLLAMCEPLSTRRTGPRRRDRTGSAICARFWRCCLLPTAGVTSNTIRLLISTRYSLA